MERKRCQVCDGPVVNGRCKLCGMPYRNDETLYHLNENRSDHYRHATSRARAIMRQEEIPLGDKKAGSAAYKAGTGKSTAGAGSSYKQSGVGKGSGQPKSAGTGNAGNKYGQKTGTGSYKSLTGAGTGSSYNKGNTKSGSTYGGGTGTAQSGNKSSVSAGSYSSQNRQTTAGAYSTVNKKGGVYTQKPVKKKKGSLLGWLIMLVIICASVPELRDSLRDSLSPILEEKFGDLLGSGADSVSYELRMGEVLEVGKEVEDGIVPGYYIASCDNGFVSFMIMGEDGETGTMTVTEGVEHKITLKEGDFIGIVNTESEDSSLRLTAR